MSDGVSILEELSEEFGSVSVGLVVFGGVTCVICAGDCIVKSAYQKRNGDLRSFRELVYENFQRVISPQDNYL